MNARDELEMLLHERIPDLKAAVAALRAEIDERKRIEAAAFRLAAIVESSHDAIISLTPEGSIENWNPAAERLLGYAAAEIIGKSMSVLVPPARQDELGRIVARAKRGERVQLETTRLTKDGNEIDVALVVSAIKDRSGALVGFSAIVRDIAERRRAEDALLRSEERFRSLVENVPHAMIVADPEGRIVLANSRTEKLFGYTPEELLGRPVEILVPLALRGGHAQHRAGYMARPSARPMGMGRDLRGRRKDGSEFPVEIGLSPLQTEEGQVVSAAIVDISERKRAEAAMIRAQRQALVVAELSQRALAGTQLGALMDEAAGRVAETLVTDYCSVWELLPDGQSLVLRAGVGWQDGNVGQAVIGAGSESPPGYALLSNAPVIVENLHTETRFHAPPLLLDHGVVSTASVIIQGPGRPFGVLAACTTKRSSFTQDDVLFLQSVANVVATANERKQAEELLRQAQKMEAIGRMTGGVAHDFNNLLTAISGNLQLLEERVAKDPLSHKLALAASKAAQRGAELVRSLLAFSRRQPLQSKSVDLNRHISGLGELLHRTLGETIDIEFALQRRGLWPTLADPHQVESALLNLAINARDAMPDGGRLRVETANVRLGTDQARREGVASPGQYVMLAVTDDGTGMPPEVAARAFEPFFTTKEPGKGSGLGLSMVYGFAKQSGGHVRIASEPGAGTTVKLYLPRVAAAVRPDVPAPARARPRLRGKGTVLLVEDDEGVREFAATVLAEAGYQVRPAAQAGEALAILEEAGEVDLLFTDLALPGGMSGQELADEARRRRPGIKLLFASGYTEHDLVQQGRRDQGAQLLAKPYTREDLAREVHLLVSGKPR